MVVVAVFYALFYLKTRHMQIPVEKEMQRMFQLALLRPPQITIAVQQQHFQAVFVSQELQYRSLP